MQVSLALMAANPGQPNRERSCAMNAGYAYGCDKVYIVILRITGDGALQTWV